jgi:hypothetical protein
LVALRAQRRGAARHLAHDLARARRWPSVATTCWLLPWKNTPFRLARRAWPRPSPVSSAKADFGAGEQSDIVASHADAPRAPSARRAALAGNAALH